MTEGSGSILLCVGALADKLPKLQLIERGKLEEWRAGNLALSLPKGLARVSLGGGRPFPDVQWQAMLARFGYAIVNGSWRAICHRKQPTYSLAVKYL